MSDSIESTNVETPSYQLEDDVKRLKAMFSVTCSKCGSVKAVRRDVYINRLLKTKSTIAELDAKYLCAKCRKDGDVDLIGNKKTASSSKFIDKFVTE